MNYCGKQSKNLKRKILISFVLVMFTVLAYFFNSESRADTNKKPEFYGTVAINLRVGDDFTQEGLKRGYYRILARDFEDGNITHKVRVTSFNVDTSREGNYSITYSVTDSANAETTIEVPVTVTANGKRSVHRKLYDFSDEYEQFLFLNNAKYTRGNYHDKQMLGVYLMAGQKLNVRVVSGEIDGETLQIQLMADDCLKENIGLNVPTINDLEGYGSVFGDNNQVYVKPETQLELSANNSSVQVENKTKVVYVNSKNTETTLDYYSNKSYNCVPFITTPKRSKNVVIEVELTNAANSNENIRWVDYFTYNDEWNRNMDNDYAVLDGSRATLLIPKCDYANLGIPKGGDEYPNDNFHSVNDILRYVDTCINTFDSYIGLKDYPEQSENKNVKSKFFVKPDVHSAGDAVYYTQYYVKVRSNSMDEFIHNKGMGWTLLHECGHGYQGIYSQDDLDFGEVTNNILAYRFQKDNLVRKLAW